MMHAPRQKGFTLLIAVVLASVVLAIGLALLDIAYKQITLAATARNSQFAFYAADGALECALYYDQQLGHFPRPPGTPVPSSITCQGQSGITVTVSNTAATSTSSFSIPCPGGSPQSSAQIAKASNGLTIIYAYGYNNCNAADTRRVERGLRVVY